MLNLNKANFKEEVVDFFNSNYRNLGIPNDKIPNKSGIYCFTWQFEDDESEQILYIGKAKYLRNRILHYNRHPLFSDKTLPILKYIYNNELPNEVYLGFNIYCFCNDYPEDYERALIEFYKPKFNTVFKKNLE